jgi:hypothetical protein
LNVRSIIDLIRSKKIMTVDELLGGGFMDEGEDSEGEDVDDHVRKLRDTLFISSHILVGNGWRSF